jgi:hypothetical protein
MLEFGDSFGFGAWDLEFAIKNRARRWTELDGKIQVCEAAQVVDRCAILL